MDLEADRWGRGLPAVGVVQVREEQHAAAEEGEQHEDAVGSVQQRLLLPVLQTQTTSSEEEAELTASQPITSQLLLFQTARSDPDVTSVPQTESVYIVV